MPKSLASFNPEDYAPVAERITLFYTRYPTGRILTELVSRTEQDITFRALVFRSAVDREPAATGWAAERIGDGDINTVACLENTETSAIGRALANLGLTASRFRPSLEELEKAERARQGTRVEGTTGPIEHGRKKAPRQPNEGLQRAADAASDALIVLAEADRAGLDSTRSTELRETILSPEAIESDVRRAERSLRRWLADPQGARPRAAEDRDVPAPSRDVTAPSQ